MKKSVLSDGPAFLSRKTGGLIAAAFAAASLLFAASLALHAADAPASTGKMAVSIGENAVIEPAASKVEGQISVILEGMIDGEDEFVFRDGKAFLQHKSYKEPIDVTVNGKPWTDLKKPFELGFTPDPVETHFVCEGRGQNKMSRSDDGVAVTVYDEEGAAARYRIILFQPSGVKEPLEQPTKPVDQTVMEIPAGTKPAAATQTAKPGPTAQTAAAEQTATSAESGALVLEGTFEGRGSFHFIDGLIVYSHKEGTEPTGVKINGNSWVNLKNPFKLNATFPVRIIRKQARGTVTLLPAEDFARLEIDDYQDGSASYRIELGAK